MRRYCIAVLYLLWKFPCYMDTENRVYTTNEHKLPVYSNFVRFRNLSLCWRIHWVFGLLFLELAVHVMGIRWGWEEDKKNFRIVHVIWFCRDSSFIHATSSGHYLFGDNKDNDFYSLLLVNRFFVVVVVRALENDKLQKKRMQVEVIKFPM